MWLVTAHWQEMEPGGESTTLLPVTFVKRFFSAAHGQKKNAARVSLTAAQLERECELMSRSGQGNEGSRWSAETWN